MISSLLVGSGGGVAGSDNDVEAGHLPVLTLSNPRCRDSPGILEMQAVRRSSFVILPRT